MPRPLRIRSVAEFISAVEKQCSTDEVLFRGQRCNYSLTPRIGRSAFHHRDDRCHSERSMLEHFRSRALPFVDIHPRNDLEWLSLAQHYGMATRLLDWTQNPLSALWFAVSAPGNRLMNGVVLFFPVLRSDKMIHADTDPLAITRTYVVRPRHLAPRITRQAGWFTVHHLEPKTNRLTPLNRNPQFAQRLRTIEIPGSHFADIRSTLDRCGINRASMLPDLANLAAHIDWLHSRLKDEKPRARGRASQNRN